MKTRIAITILLSTFLLASCNQTNYPNEIKTIDSLLTRIDSAENLYSKIDTSGLYEEGRTFKMKFNFVKNAYEQSEDTLNHDMAILISEYRDLRKPYAQFKDMYVANAKELEFSKKQLFDLRHDLEYNLLDTNFVRRMVNSERDATESLVNETKNLFSGRKSIIDENNRLEPKIDSLITVLKK